VSDLFDSSTLIAALTDARFPLAVGVALLSGLVRGFAGFGSALIYVPLLAAIYEPRTAAATLLLIDFVSGAPFAVRAFPHCNWREVMPISIASAVAVPVGTLALLVLDPVVLRWIISALVISVVVVLASGWRYHGQPRLPVSLAVGALSGLGGGAVQIAGPPVIIYWLGGASQAAIVRANLMVFFVLTGAALFVSYAVQGLLDWRIVQLSVALGVPYTVAMVAGARMFHGTSDRRYRAIAYGIMAGAGLASLPVFDHLLR
jgi:hypothetical protein